MPAEEVAWQNARVIADRDPEHDRQDRDGMPMWRELLNRPQVGGWAVNEHGDAEAFSPTSATQRQNGRIRLIVGRRTP